MSHATTPGPNQPSDNTVGTHDGHTFGDNNVDNTSLAHLPSGSINEAQGIIDRFRKGSSTHRAATSGIEVAIRRGAQEAGIPFSEDLLLPYLEQLDSHLEAVSEAEAVGQNLGLNRTRGTKRGRYQSPGSDSDGSDEEEMVRVSRKKKVDKSKLAWEFSVESSSLRELALPTAPLESRLGRSGAERSGAARKNPLRRAAETVPLQADSERAESARVAEIFLKIFPLKTCGFFSL
ncbi:hypothetical protein PQX77_017663 [Marasmius sp. AFHP31]|nr:hypothetical protein PQX77_017663 [Marasmius sp. AFHP31]